MSPHRVRRAGGVAIAGALVLLVLAAFLASTGSAAGEADALTALVAEVRASHDLFAGVGAAADRLNVLRGVGLLFGVGIGVALGSIATYRSRRH